jgi:hypothetical protein
MFQGKKNKKKLNFFFEVQRGPCQAIVDNGLAAALPNLKCFKEKNLKIKE